MSTFFYLQRHITVIDLSQWTKEEIKKLGSLSKLAKALNLTRQAVMSWRDGEVVTLSDKSAVAIANYLGCSLGEVRSMFKIEVQNTESVLVLTAKVARLERIVARLVDAVDVSLNEPFEGAQLFMMIQSDITLYYYKDQRPQYQPKTISDRYLDLEGLSICLAASQAGSCSSKLIIRTVLGKGDSITL